MVAKFSIFDVVEGDITPQFVLLSVWPSVEALENSVNDPRFVEGKALLEDAT